MPNEWSGTAHKERGTSGAGRPAMTTKRIPLDIIDIRRLTWKRRLGEAFSVNPVAPDGQLVDGSARIA